MKRFSGFGNSPAKQDIEPAVAESTGTRRINPITIEKPKVRSIYDQIGEGRKGGSGVIKKHPKDEAFEAAQKRNPISGLIKMITG